MALEEVLRQMKDDQDTQLALSNSAMQSHQVNPDSQAGAIKLQRQTGLPVQAFPEMSEEAKLQVLTDQMHELPEKAPALAQYLSDPEKAKLSHDDIGALSKVEDSTSFLGKAKKYLDENVFRVPITQGYVQYQKGVGGMYQWVGESLVQPLIDAVTTDGMRQEHGTSNLLTIWGKQMQAEANAVQGQINLEHPVDPNSWAGAIRGGMSSTFQQLPMMAGGALATTVKGATAATLGAMGLMTGGSTYGEKRDAGFSEFQAGMAATGTETVEIATEMFPTEKVFELLKPAAKMGVKAVFSKVSAIFPGRR